jgi:large subunit ribosomal protein L37Ae
MAVEKRYGTIKRFGARYGRTLKLRLAKVESVQRGKHKCPYCNSLKAKRLSTGIWHCRKCNAKFTGKAYSIEQVIKTKKEPREEKKEAEKEEEE